MHYNISTAPACAIYISQLIWFSRACGSYLYFLARGLLLTRNLLNHVMLVWLIWSHHSASLTVGIMIWTLITEYMCLRWPRRCWQSRSPFLNYVLSPSSNNSNITGFTSAGRPFLPFRSTWVHSRFLVFCGSLVFAFSFLFCLLICLSFFDLRLLVIPLISSRFCSFAKKSVKHCVQHGILFTILTSYIL